jgi:adenine/guanine/hypoxanthine permease
MRGLCMRTLDSFFRIRERGSTVSTELHAGLVTFLTMAYILLVNPQILSQAGMPPADVTVATALGAAVGSALMGLFANYPFALAPGIGLFIAIIGLRNAGLVVASPTTLVQLGDLHQPTVLMALGGLLVTAALAARGVKGALLLGIAVVTGMAWALGLAPTPTSFFSVPSLPRETLWAMDFSLLLTGKFLTVVMAFLFVEIFDTAGTLLGVGRLGGFLTPKGELPRADRAFAADAMGTITGAVFGTSTVTAYIESAAGVKEGGRTGLTALTVAVLFLLSLFFVPLLASIPAVATAPALVVVGAMMMSAGADIQWGRLDEGLPAFLTMAFMPFTYSIANGISAGLISYAALKLITGRPREAHPVLYVLAGALTLYYALS